MKIVLFMDSPLVPTGYASTCRLTAKQLQKLGHEVWAMGFNGGSPEQVSDWYGLKVIPNYALKREKNAIYGDVETIIQVDQEIKPDIFFLHNDSYRYSYLPKLPKDILDRCVFWLPFEGEAEDVLGVQLFSRCAATRFVTKHALNVHAGSLKGKDIGYIPHAVDLSVLSPSMDKVASKREKNMGIDGKFLVVRVDRHQPRKYWDLTLQAFAKFAKGKDDVSFLGKCNPRDITMYDAKEKKGMDLDALADVLGIKDKVKFDDFFFDGSYMAKAFYHPADVFLTTTSGEGFGLTPAESMACGVPVIYPETPVLPEVVGEAGLSCKLARRDWYDKMQVWHNIVDVDDVASKLEWAYQDWKGGGNRLAEIGAKGRSIATAKYHPEVVYGQWDEVFRRVASRKNLVSMITVLCNFSGDEQLNGDQGISKFKESVEKYVKHPYEWIIVDNGSPAREATRAWLKQAAESNPNIHVVILDTNMGFGAANNIGIKMATGKHVVLANPDCEALDPQKMCLPADFLAMMTERADREPGAGIVAMETNRRDDVLSGSMFPYFCCVLLTRPCLDAIKLCDGKWFDEGFWPAYYEDLDICIRAMGKGFKTVEQNCPFWHKSGGTNKHAIEGGKSGPCVKPLSDALETLAISQPSMADWPRKRGELAADGMQGLIAGNIAYLNKKWGREARSKIKIVWGTHIGEGVGFSAIAEGIVPQLHKLGFDVYVDDWSGGSKVEDPLIKDLIVKTRKAKEDGTLEDAIYVACWLMESFLTIDSTYKVGISFCESTKVRPSYLNACNAMDRILTFSEFCKGVQKNSGYTAPTHVLPPGVHPIFMEQQPRPSRGTFTFLSVGVSQKRKATEETIMAFCRTFPKAKFPNVELVVKSNNFGDLDWVKKSGAMEIANIRPMFTGWDKRAERKDFSLAEMREMYQNADCLVHASRGEGCGLPILEGAATGLPVIFTRWSSPAEYLDDSNSYPLSLDPQKPFVPAYEGHGGLPGENGQWANPNWEQLSALMMHVYQNRDEAAKKGKAAAETMRKRFNWEESARHLMPLLFEWDAERKQKAAMASFDPMTFVKPKIEPVRPGDRVLIDCTTRDRHPYLAALLTSLWSQTFKDWDILIEIDDSDESVLRNHQLLGLLNRIGNEGHGWQMIRSHQQGPHIAHDRTLQMAKDHPKHKYKLICRIDDDIIVRPDYLENLYALFLEDKNCEIAAVGGIYPYPDRDQKSQSAPPDFATSIEYAGKIDHNVPWPYVCFYPEGTKPRLVEHLYSSFLYRVEVAVAIGGYCRLFSQIGHREESDLTARFFYGGYKMFIQPKSIGFHFQAPSGGIRSEAIIDKKALAESDDRIYRRRLAKWKKGWEDRMAASARCSSRPNPLPELKKNKVVAVINGGGEEAKIRAAVERFSPMADEIYVSCHATCAQVAAGLSSSKLKMVATSPDDVALLTRALLAEGDHEFILNVSDTMSFEGNPIALLSDAYDDYVFEVYQSYDVGTADWGPVLGTEVRNQCLITRRRTDARPRLERTMYSDMVVIQDDRLKNVKGLSATGNALIPKSEMATRSWRKLCVFQFPEGRLDPPRYIDVRPAPRVSILIPTPGRREHLKRCLDSIWSNTGTPFEVVVIDNGSADGTEGMLADMAKARPNLTVLRQPVNVGFQKAINIGMGKAKGEFIMLFNDDALVKGTMPDGRDWLRFYIDELNANPSLGLVGPHGCQSPVLGKPILFFWCVLFRRWLWELVGPLDDVTFFNYGGDDDFCERVRAKGFGIKENAINILAHLMNLVPEEVKQKELEESRVKLRAKYGLEQEKK